MAATRWDGKTNKKHKNSRFFTVQHSILYRSSRRRCRPSAQQSDFISYLIQNKEVNLLLLVRLGFFIYCPYRASLNFSAAAMMMLVMMVLHHHLFLFSAFFLFFCFLLLLSLALASPILLVHVAPIHEQRRPADSRQMSQSSKQPEPTDYNKPPDTDTILLFFFIPIIYTTFPRESR